jgi:peptidyl-prolyl cis-trans isomerase C
MRYGCCALGLSALLGILLGSRGTASSADNDERRRAVALTQGETQFTVGQVEDALARVPDYQLPEFGKTAAEVRKTFVEREFIANLLLARGAEKKNAAGGGDAWASLRLKRVLADATRRKAAAGATVSDQDVSAYYTDHKADYTQEARILVWRILLEKRSDAQALLKDLQAQGTVKAFTEAARDKSLDKASYLRSGSLGFLRPDGYSEEAKLKMDLALVTAAQNVKDGEFVREVVQEGEAFAVVWRRGSTPKREQALDDVRQSIREKLERLALEKAERALIERLRKEHLQSVDPAGLGAFEVDLGTGSIAVKK